MKRKSLRSMECLIALALDRVGEWWSMLIVREAIHGVDAFRPIPEGARHCAQHADAAARSPRRKRPFRAAAIQRAPAALRIRANRAWPRFLAGDRFAHGRGATNITRRTARWCFLADTTNGQSRRPKLIDSADWNRDHQRTLRAGAGTKSQPAGKKQIWCGTGMRAGSSGDALARGLHSCSRRHE